MDVELTSRKNAGKGRGDSIVFSGKIAKVQIWQERKTVGKTSSREKKASEGLSPKGGAFPEMLNCKGGHRKEKLCVFWGRLALEKGKGKRPAKLEAGESKVTKNVELRHALFEKCHCVLEQETAVA